MSPIGRFIPNGSEGEEPRSEYSQQPDQKTDPNSEETWSEQTRKLTQEVREVISDSVDQFVAKLTNANIRVEQCNPGEASSVTTRTVITAESEEKAREKLSAVGEISINQTQNQVAIEQTADSVISGISMDSGYISVSGNSTVVIRQIMTGGTASISGGLSGSRIEINGQVVNSDQLNRGVSGAMVEKREVILRVQPDAQNNYGLSTKSGAIDIPKGCGRASLNVERGRVDIGQFDGEVNSHLESGSLTAKSIVGSLDSSCERGNINLGSMQGPTTLKVESGNVDVQSAVGELQVKMERGNIGIGTSTGKTLLSTESGNVSIQTISGGLSVKIERGNIALGLVAGPAQLQIQSGSTSVEKLTGDLRAKTERGNISLSIVQGNLTLQTSSGDINLGSIAGEISAQIERGSVSARRLDLRGKSNRVATQSGSIDLGITSTDVKLEASADSGSVAIRGLTETQRTDQRGRNTRVVAYCGDISKNSSVSLVTSTQRGNIVVNRV